MPVAGASGNLCVRDSAELVVLVPQIFLEQLSRSEELEDRHVALAETRTRRGRGRIGQQPRRCDRPRSHRGPFEHEGTTAGQMPRLLILSIFVSC